MSTFNVFYYMTFHTRIDDIEADSPLQAAIKGLDKAFEAGHTIGGMWGDFEFAEECTGALVDVVGDKDYLQSQSFTQEEIYDA